MGDVVEEPGGEVVSEGADPCLECLDAGQEGIQESDHDEDPADRGGPGGRGASRTFRPRRKPGKLRGRWNVHARVRLTAVERTGPEQGAGREPIRRTAVVGQQVVRRRGSLGHRISNASAMFETSSFALPPSPAEWRTS